MAKPITYYLRTDKMPHIWCEGCGHGIVLGAVLRAIDSLDLDKDNVCVVSGIGCASRAPGYLDFDTLHTTHGRALAFATGIKMMKPGLDVIVLAGDGDLAAIGGNHLIHAARRNINITTICFNNSIYGMTSGQYSPMTPTGKIATTAPYGHIEEPFDLCELVFAAGASLVGRGAAYHSGPLSRLIAKAIATDGFAFVEAVSQCPTYFGRRNKMKNALAMLDWQKEHAVTKKAASRLSPEELADKFVIGELGTRTRPEYTKRYESIIAAAAKETDENV
ncbi:MAG TPA: thiamine pyrophosphate-dependent enzyme [Bacillota bacterium]|nr:thiamine pyrophosphate-dependent enzyme [Bacillota bacterium]